MITLKYYAPLRGILGVAEETLDATNVHDALHHIKQAYGKEAYRAAGSALIVINDVSIDLRDGMKTKLNDGDTLGFLPVCGGG